MSGAQDDVVELLKDMREALLSWQGNRLGLDFDDLLARLDDLLTPAPAWVEVVVHRSVPYGDDDGVWWAECSCGWSQGPVRSREEAESNYADHRQ